MQVEIWADVVCPWCGLGTHRFEQALAQFAHRDDVEVVHRSFQLDPNAEAGPGRPAKDMLLAKGYPAEQIEPMMSRIEDMAEAEGLQPYRVVGSLTGSTALVHELLAFATDQGKGADAWKAAYGAQWGEGTDVFTLDSVIALGTGIGLDETELRAALTDRRYQERVVADQAEAQQLGASGVPFFVIDRRYGVGGAQPTEQFLDVLETAWSELHGNTLENTDDAAVESEA